MKNLPLIARIELGCSIALAGMGLALAVAWATSPALLSLATGQANHVPPTDLLIALLIVLSLGLGFLGVHKVTTDASLRARVREAFEADQAEACPGPVQCLAVVSAVYSDLRCPHCEVWIGDCDNSDIAKISTHHDLTRCEERQRFEALDPQRQDIVRSYVNESASEFFGPGGNVYAAVKLAHWELNHATGESVRIALKRAEASSKDLVLSGTKRLTWRHLASLLRKQLKQF